MHAARQTQESDRSIAEIASAVGFLPIRVISDRRFRRHFGRTRGHFRQGGGRAAERIVRKQPIVLALRLAQPVIFGVLHPTQIRNACTPPGMRRGGVAHAPAHRMERRFLETPATAARSVHAGARSCAGGFSTGERLLYSNPGIAMLAVATTAALREALEK